MQAIPSRGAPDANGLGFAVTYFLSASYNIETEYMLPISGTFFRWFSLNLPRLF